MRRFPARWWRHGIVAPVALAVAGAAVLGAGVGAHVLRQAERLGDPVDYRFFEPDWLSWRALDEYLSTGFLALAAVALVVLAWRRSSGDAALLARGIARPRLRRSQSALAARDRVRVPAGRIPLRARGRPARRRGRRADRALDDRRAGRPPRVRRSSHTSRWVFGFPNACLAEPGARRRRRLPHSTLSAAGSSEGDLPDARLVVADRCLHFIVPYLLERPTIAAFEDWQVAYRDRVPAARKARSVIAGGSSWPGEVAADLHVGYVVADPLLHADTGAGARGDARSSAGGDVLVLRLPG